jgi:hypothetical protein
MICAARASESPGEHVLTDRIISWSTFMTALLRLAESTARARSS